MTTKTHNIGGDSNSFAFDKPGDSVTGRILDFEEIAQTDMDSGKPAVWDDGRPKMMLRVDLQTALREDDGDDGNRAVFIRGSKKPETCSSLAAVAGAIKAATGGSAIQVGATLTLTYTGDGETTKRGWNPPKRYSAKYVALSAALGTHAQPGDAEAIKAMETPTALTPEQIQALITASRPAAVAAPVDPIATHPQGAALRNAGVSDEQIKIALGIA